MASTPVDSSGWIRCWKGLKRSTQRGTSSFLPSSLPHLLSLRQPRIRISAALFPHSSATQGVGGGHGATTASLESPDLEASGGDGGKGVEELKMLNRIATVKDDGTVVVDVPSTLEVTLVDVGGEDGYGDVAAEESLDGADIPYRPPIQIVILVVGTRGDVQPFVAIGKCLQDYGHRVRLATHANYKEFVLTAGLEFFPLGGDPKILVEYMVKNKGLLPSGPSEVLIQRKQMKEIIFSLLPACKDPDPDTSIPFKVDAIIANPPAYGHTHVAEALKVPIHIFFTMPWT